MSASAVRVRADAGGGGPVVLDADACRDVLARATWGVLATAGADGPYAVPVGYALAGHCVYLATGPGLKRHNMEASPAVCLTVCEVAGPERWRSVVVRGMATPVNGIAERGIAVAAFVRQRGASGVAGADAGRLLRARFFRVSLEGMTGRGKVTPQERAAKPRSE